MASFWQLLSPASRCRLLSRRHPRSATPLKHVRFDTARKVQEKLRRVTHRRAVVSHGPRQVRISKLSQRLARHASRVNPFCKRLVISVTCPLSPDLWAGRNTKRETPFHGRIHHPLFSTLIFRSVQRCVGAAVCYLMLDEIS